ncbi:hypothetical protein NQ314_010144 [Rhamnusium bicolor]|uniref:Ig-like domain-containing protein n=1 Tax=Rhamnusium bicolor TaxID=1586634 RepID=A0AAV8XTW2_9CUCU|nr:hypothetical protein NQ314_010144 [Rhamnusium bicolor]
MEVSWMRKRDLHILTSGIHTYTGDARFSVRHPEHSDDWDLRIEYVQKRDGGVYECQVNTEPKINLAIILNVDGKYHFNTCIEKRTLGAKIRMFISDRINY